MFHFINENFDRRRFSNNWRLIYYYVSISNVYLWKGSFLLIASNSKVILAIFIGEISTLNRLKIFISSLLFSRRSV